MKIGLLGDALCGGSILTVLKPDLGAFALVFQKKSLTTLRVLNHLLQGHERKSRCRIPDETLKEILAVLTYLFLRIG